MGVIDELLKEMHEKEKNAYEQGFLAGMKNMLMNPMKGLDLKIMPAGGYVEARVFVHDQLIVEASAYSSIDGGEHEEDMTKRALCYIRDVIIDTAVARTNMVIPDFDLVKEWHDLYIEKGEKAFTEQILNHFNK